VESDAVAPLRRATVAGKVFAPVALFVMVVACVVLLNAVTSDASGAAQKPVRGRIYFEVFVDHGTRTATEWVSATGGQSHRLPIPAGNNITTPTASPNGTAILFTTTKGTFSRWLPTGTWIARPDGTHARRVDRGYRVGRCAAWSPDGDSFVQLVGANTDPRTLQIVTTRGAVRTIDVGTTKLGCATFLDRNTILYERENSAGEVEIWQTPISTPSASRVMISMPGCNTIEAQVSPDHRQV